MITIQILEETDLIQGDDWCRPLRLTPDASGQCPARSMYSGAPENNTRWVRVSAVIGKGWVGQSVGAFTRVTSFPYEFVRGDVPIQHRLDMTGYSVLSTTY